MNFSIVLPSLGNKQQVLKMLNSFERTTRYKDKIEFLIAVDEGSSKITTDLARETFSFDITFFERPKTKDFTNDYYNWLADRSTGKNIMVFNDDAWMRTQDWDANILREIADSRWSIYCLDIPDTARIKYKHTFPCFPCVSRRAFCTLGFVLCKDIKMYPADKVTFAIYENAQRVIPIRNVLIEHEHVAETDESKKHMYEAFLEEHKNRANVDISEYVYTLLLAGQSDIKRFGKLRRIINIIKE